MKTGLVVGLISAFVQLCVSVFVCRGVYVGEADAGMFAGFYFNFLGYLPLGSLLAAFVPGCAFFPQLDFQNKTSFVSYMPSVAVATLNWFLIGFLAGLAFERSSKRNSVNNEALNGKGS